RGIRRPFRLPVWRPAEHDAGLRAGLSFVRPSASVLDNQAEPRTSASRHPLCDGEQNSFPPGLLILRRKLLAGLDLERRIRRQDTIGIHVLVDEVEGIFGDDAAGELERYRIQREALDDVQFVAVGECACQAARLEADSVDDERIAVPAAD